MSHKLMATKKTQHVTSQFLMSTVLSSKLLLYFRVYGGIQNIHLNCLYQDVVNFMQAQGWLNTKLNADWEVNAFQFYAGDLYDMMNSLYKKVNPRAILEG
jgi:hypothetical protein